MHKKRSIETSRDWLICVKCSKFQTSNALRGVRENRCRLISSRVVVSWISMNGIRLTVFRCCVVFLFFDNFHRARTTQCCQVEVTREHVLCIYIQFFFEFLKPRLLQKNLMIGTLFLVDLIVKFPSSRIIVRTKYINHHFNLIYIYCLFQWWTIIHHHKCDLIISLQIIVTYFCFWWSTYVRRTDGEPSHIKHQICFREKRAFLRTPLYIFMLMPLFLISWNSHTCNIYNIYI